LQFCAFELQTNLDSPIEKRKSSGSYSFFIGQGEGYCEFYYWDISSKTSYSIFSI